MKKYKFVVGGGTFDLLHKGHKAFLQAMADLSEKVLLGITSDRYIEDHKGFGIGSFSERKKAVENYLQDNGMRDVFEIVAIDRNDVSDADKNMPLEAIIVTPETKKGAEFLNSRRVEASLSPLPIVETPLVVGQDGFRISSKRIRNGEIDRDGLLFVQPEWYTQTLVLPESLREELHKAAGELIVNPATWFTTNAVDATRTITVGDATTKACNELEVDQRIAVIDFFVKRQKQFSSLDEYGFKQPFTLLKVVNPAGQITGELFQAVRQVFEKEYEKFVIVVDGEEDLAVLPCLLLAPLGYKVLYGQPDEGVVLIEVTEETKRSTRKTLQNFTLKS